MAHLPDIVLDKTRSCVLWYVFLWYVFLWYVFLWYVFLWYVFLWYVFLVLRSMLYD